VVVNIPTKQWRRLKLYMVGHLQCPDLSLGKEQGIQCRIHHCHHLLAMVKDTSSFVERCHIHSLNNK
jgi:hypothetical protein